MNRRGDVPTILLFIVAIALILSSLFIFVSFSGKFSVSKEMAEMLYTSDFAVNYIVSETETIATNTVIGNIKDCNGGNFEDRFRCIAEEREANRLSLAGNLFGKIRNNEFKVYKNEKNYVVEIKNLSVKVNVVGGLSDIERNFDLNVSVDFDGRILSSKVS